MPTGQQLLHGIGVWPQLAATLTGAGRTGSSPAYVAVAYIGSTADTWLPLREGDVLICDASEEAVQLGLTSVAQLQRWHTTGVRLFSRQGLHAKAGVIGRRAFIGSANLSQRSASDRHEATVVTSDPGVVTALRVYVRSLMNSPSLALNDAALLQLAKIPVRKPRWPSAAPVEPPVPDKGRLWVIEWAEGSRTKREITQFAAVQQQHADELHRADYLEDFRFADPGALRPMRIGDILLFSNREDDWTYPPAVLIDKLAPAHHQRAGIVYRMRGDLKQLRTKHVDAAIIAAQPGWRRRGVRTAVSPQVRAAIAALDWKRK
ncbi:phospholipase D-like domain-containing protein [Geodermatophilus sp. SYSU D00697]